MIKIQLMNRLRMNTMIVKIYTSLFKNQQQSLFYTKKLVIKYMISVPLTEKSKTQKYHPFPM